MTHGYHYDASRHAARWLSDTWSMSLRPPYKWHLLHSKSGLLEPAAAFIFACTKWSAAPLQVASAMQQPGRPPYASKCQRRPLAAMA